MSRVPSIDEVVLTAAAGLGAAERERYLREIAAVDADLAETARRRLAVAEDLPDSFLGRPAAACMGGASEFAAAPPPPPSAALPPEERYELGEQLGEGGMGRVVEAFDRQLGRPVALKLLVHDDPAILRLFLREARAQARVRHDNVLEVYDSGELGGRPFIAMRLVEGGTLADVADTLSLEQKVLLLAQAAEGLHAAHRRGLLHRDVKPSNILVERNDDGGPRALVTDFGLAADLADLDASAGEDVAGSPQYIAPERLLAATSTTASTRTGTSAALDRRSDVYSLGITLYRLLTGTLPWEGEATVRILRRAASQDPPAPRFLSPSLPKELEAIILRCTARDPERRYASARAVAADLRRYLDGEVVEAYAAGLAYRLTRFVLRNKVLAGVTTTALAALLASSVAVAVFAVRADTARGRAELRRSQAEELIRFMVVDLQGKLESLGRLDVLADVGEAALGYFAAVPEDELSEEELLRRSRMLYQIGDVRIRSGDLRGAATPMAESLALAKRLAELRPDDGERLFELGQAYFWVGAVAWEQGDLAAAREPFEAYLEVSKRLLRFDPSRLAWRKELSYAHSNLGSLLEAEGDFEGALEQFRATLAVDEALVEIDPGDAARSELAATHNTLGVVLEALGRLDEAESHLRRDLDIRMELGDTGPRARELLGAAYGHLGAHLLRRGDPATARQLFEEMYRITRALVDHDPENAAWRYQLAWSRLRLGMAAWDLGESETADEHWRAALEIGDAQVALGSTSHKWIRTRATCLFLAALLHASRAELEAARRQVSAAVELLADLAASRPTDRFVQLWLGRSRRLADLLQGPPSIAVEAARAWKSSDSDVMRAGSFAIER